jgi:MoxR-like ATPase
MLSWFDSSADILALVGESARRGAIVSDIYRGPFPIVSSVPENKEGEPRIGCAVISKVMMGDSPFVTVVAAVLEPDDTVKFTTYCGDPQVKGEHRVAGKVLAAALRKAGSTDNTVANSLEASSWVGVCPECEACNFFPRFVRTKNACTHVQAALAQIPPEQFDQMAADVRSWAKGGKVKVDARGEFGSPEEAAFYDAAFIQHVLLAGERGSGKTYLARHAADRFDAVYLEMQMHPSMEPWEFRAHDRAWNGKVYTVLGKLAEAVYWIQQGKRVVLCMDEFLNMNPMYTTAINTPLSLTADDTYVIETGRIIDMGDGIGRIETVEVPADKLWVVATTNIGARYNLEKIPPSVRARFQIILMNTNAARTESIVSKSLAKYGLPVELAAMFKNFIESIHEFVAQRSLDEEATTRLACNAIRAVALRAIRDERPLTSKASALRAVKAQLMAEITQVVNFENGPLDPEQAQIYELAVNKAFR